MANKFSWQHRSNLARMALALAIGAVGGVTFSRLNLPLPWMIGPMVFNLASALVGLPTRSPTGLRPYVVVVIGVMLGSGFSPEIIGQLWTWGASFLVLGLYLFVSGALTVPYYRRFGGLDPITAFFAGMPGGLNEMTAIGKEMGGDERAIALAHASRIVLVVSLIVIWFQLVSGYDLGNRARAGVSFLDIPASELAILAGAGIGGFILGKAVRLPAPTLIGPMILSAALHLAGVVENPAPRELLIVAQVILGTIIGGRFVGARPLPILRAILMSFGATLIMLAVTLFFAVVFHGFFGQTTEQVIMAYSPGGLAEMSLVALSLHAEVAYVASHHMARIVMIALVAPLVFSVLHRNRGKDRD